MAVNNSAFRFAQIDYTLTDGTEFRYLLDKWEFTFHTLEAQQITALDSLPDIRKFLYDAEAGEGGDLVDAIDKCEAFFADVLIPAAEKMADNSDKNLDNPDWWRWIFARLPLTAPLADAITAMTPEQARDFSVGGDWEGGDQEAGLARLIEAFPDANLKDADSRIGTLYTEGENCFFDTETKPDHFSRGTQS